MKKKLLLALSILIILTLTSCSINTLTMTEGAAQNNGSVVVTPSNESENESQYPERSSEWLSQPPLIKDFLEGDSESCPVRIIGGEFYAPERYGIGIYVANVYAIDLTKSSITFDGQKHKLTKGYSDVGNYDDEEDPKLLINSSIYDYSFIWVRNADKPFAEEIASYNEQTGRYIPAYDVVLEITIIPNKGEEPVFYKIHAYPDGWTEDEFPLSDFYAWAEEKFGSTEE